MYHTDLEELCQAEYMEKYRSQSEIIGDLKRRRVRRKHVGETSPESMSQLRCKIQAHHNFCLFIFTSNSTLYLFRLSYTPNVCLVTSVVSSSLQPHGL